MPRRSIYDVLEVEEFNPNGEYERLKHKFFREYRFDGDSLRERSKKVFSRIEVRGTCIDIDDFTKRLGIDFSKGYHNQDELFDFIELIVLIHDSDPGPAFVKDDEYSSVFRNINIILEKTAHKLIRTDKGRIVVPADAVAEEAAEIIAQDNPRTALEILKYNHRSNKGDVEAKRKILKSLGDTIEPWLTGQHHKDTEDAIGYILNNFNIRHNNISGSSKKEFFVTLDENEIEEWYDNLYTLIVSFIIEREQKTILEKVFKHRKNNQ